MEILFVGLFLLTLPSASEVVCGNHRAKNCAACPAGNGESWCNGECRWNSQSGVCEPKSGGSDEDLYELLEVDDAATDAEIKKNYRKLSVKYHPDKNANSAAKFNAIRDAYEVLSNPSKRVLYDTGGWQAVKDGEQGKLDQGENLERKLVVSLSELYTGAQRTLEVERRVVCRRCRRRWDAAKCQGCTSCPPTQRMVQEFRGHMIFQHMQQVPSSEDCRSDRLTLNIAVEKGAFPGERMTFEHKAAQMPGQVPGHVIVTLKIREDHHPWNRVGIDLRYPLEISLRESLLGFRRKIKHLDGHTVEISTNSVSRPGQVIKIVGEGMPVKDAPSQAGDLYFVVSVQYPSSFTEDERSELEAVSALQRASIGLGREGSRAEL